MTGKAKDVSSTPAACTISYGDACANLLCWTHMNSPKGELGEREDD
jgi:hypothetical protein